jgi:hypothetical protein
MGACGGDDLLGFGLRLAQGEKHANRQRPGPPDAGAAVNQDVASGLQPIRDARSEAPKRVAILRHSEVSDWERLD